MNWHATHASKDKCMRVPSDSKAWKHIDAIYPEFSAETRNLRLGLGTDGFNALSQQSSNYSIWPVLLVNYNLPPWYTIKNGHIMLSMIIPGPKQVQNFDTYLMVLVEELMEFWDIGLQLRMHLKINKIVPEVSRFVESYCGQYTIFRDTQLYPSYKLRDIEHARFVGMN